MATRKNAGDAAAAKATGGSDKRRLDRVGSATSQIVTEAAALLDEEVAAGIVAARRMQRRFETERRLDPADFQEALGRFQRDAHEVVTLLHRQFTGLQSEENREVIGKLVENSHDLLDLVVGLVNVGTELGNQLIQKTLPPQPPKRGRAQR